MTAFTLHPQLERDSFFVSDMALSRVLLMNNNIFPWVILVPRIAGAQEIIDLGGSQRHVLMDEIAQMSNIMQAQFNPDKLNIAALGNQVPQLHIHIICRYKKDPSWPSPVWGGPSAPYTDAKPLIERLRANI